MKWLQKLCIVHLLSSFFIELMVLLPFLPYKVPETVEIPQTEAMQFAQDLKIGWNLGDSLDACLPDVYGLDTETCWAEPRTTPEIMQLVKDAGYKTVRIPVTWGNHMSPGPDYIIEPEWLDRVQEVVDYAYDIGLNVILNTHNEERYWHVPDRKHEAAVSAQMAALWSQVAERFQNYGERLLFESMNEPRVPGRKKSRIRTVLWSGAVRRSSAVRR